MFTPYLIQDTQVQDSDGKTQTLRIGYIGFVPPQIMTWDKANLSGKVTVNDITATARKFVRKCVRKARTWWWSLPTPAFPPTRIRPWRRTRLLFKPGAWGRCHYVRPRARRLPEQRFCRYQRRRYRERYAERRTGSDAGHGAITLGWSIWF